MFTQKDLQQIRSKGISIDEINQQIKHFQHGFPPADSTMPATPGKGIMLLTEGAQKHYKNIFLDNAPDNRIIRFIPASGAASRMFKALFNALEKLEGKDPEAQWKWISGKKDLPHIQTLKGMVREWESACLWAYFGWSSGSVEDLRLGFYKGEVFTEEPEMRRDVLPVLELLRKINPDYVTVAFDPEASGPDTHYKVLQAVSEALKLYEKESGRSDIKVLGYRNVWYRFHPSEANTFVPVSLNMLTLQHYSFMNTYISQKEASFPSYEHKGPFSELSQKIQVEQYENLSIALGQDYFYEHPSALMRATRGFAFVRIMALEEFHSFSRELKRRAENL